MVTIWVYLIKKIVLVTKSNIYDRLFLQTPLHLAIRDNSLEIIELLLAFGADPALRDNKGNTGLHVAAALGASACLQLLAGNTRHKDDLNELNDCGKRSRFYHMLICLSSYNKRKRY